MAVQLRPDEIINLIRGDVQMRYEPQFAWKSACSTYLALPVLRGLWSISAIAYTNPQVLDISGNGLHLTNNNAATFGYLASPQLAPVVNLVLASTQSLSRADGGAANAFDITGTEAYVLTGAKGLTAYAWVYFDNAASAQEYIISKFNPTGNQRSYRLIRQATGELRGTVSVDGTATTNVTTTATLAQDTWYFVALQYEPSNELSVWINSDKTTLAAGIPASIFDSTSDFYLGSDSRPLLHMDGKLSLVALCASFHSDATIRATFNQTRAMFNI